MATHLEHVAARVVGRPLLIMPQKLGVIAQVLAGRIGLDLEAPELGLDVAARPEPLASRFVGSRRDRDSGAGLPYVRTDAGTALITVTGSLVNRGAWLGASSGLTSYEGIAAQVRAALADPKVATILLDLDTGGGEATGAFELAELVRQANATKPVTAFVNGLAASAGYMIASGAGRIVSVPSGVTGSIGVVMMHADYSRALEKAGITPTLILAGKHKVDANPYAPLDAGTKARLQAELEAMREDFVQLVAKGRRGRISAKAVRDTEAAVFSGKEALAAGLVDELATFDALYASMNRSADTSRPAGNPQGRRLTMDEAAQIRAEAAVAERARIKAILTAPEAKGREPLAAHLAYDTSQPAPVAIAGLRAAAGDAARAAPVIDHAAIYARARGEQPARNTSAARGSERTIDAEAIYATLNGTTPDRRDDAAAAPVAGSRTILDPEEIYRRRREG